MALRRLLLIIILLFTFIVCVGCEDATPKFRNLEGYTLVYVRQDYGNSYGYVKTEEVEQYTKGQLDKMKLLYPYKGIKEDQFVIVDTASIRYITIGEQLILTTR